MKSRGKIIILCAVVGVSICAALFSFPTLRLTSASSPTEVFIANVSSKPNESVVAEILIRNVEEPGVSATTINLTYNSSVVNAVSVNSSDFDSIEFNINNSFEFTKIIAYQAGAAGLIEDVKLAEIEFKAVGREGEVSPLNIEVITLKDNGGNPIQHEVRNGSFTVKGYAQFDTGSPGNHYPSIFGIHNGTIKPNETIKVHTLYTYPCAGTGGHSEHIKIWNDSGWNRAATWDGYEGDWHNISFGESFILQPGAEYDYTIITGSYPQIIHAKEYKTLEGSFINCTEFTDANGKIYTDWIPAIRLGV